MLTRRMADALPFTRLRNEMDRLIERFFGDYEPVQAWDSVSAASPRRSCGRMTTMFSWRRNFRGSRTRTLMSPSSETSSPSRRRGQSVLAVWAAPPGLPSFPIRRRVNQNGADSLCRTPHDLWLVVNRVMATFRRHYGAHEDPDPGGARVRFDGGTNSIVRSLPGISVQA